MQFSRNCFNSHEKSEYAYFLGIGKEKEKISQCPISYFWDISEIFTQYNRIKTMKEIGVSIGPESITLLELDAYSIIEEEQNKINCAKIDKDVTDGRRNNRNKLPGKSR